MVAELAQKIARTVDDSVRLAMRVSSKVFLRRGSGVRVADAVDCDDGACEAVGEAVDLSGEALAEAADLDVSRELVPLGVTPASKLSLLGLVAALGHDVGARPDCISIN